MIKDHVATLDDERNEIFCYSTNEIGLTATTTTTLWRNFQEKKGGKNFH